MFATRCFRLRMNTKIVKTSTDCDSRERSEKDALFEEGEGISFLAALIIKGCSAWNIKNAIIVHILPLN